MKIALVGVFGIHNFGNEASLAAMLASVTRTFAADVVVLCDTPSQVEADYGVAAEPLYSTHSRPGLISRLLTKVTDFRRVLRTVATSDAVVIPGTGIFEGLWIRPGGVPLAVAGVALACKLTRRPLLSVSVGVDEAVSPLTRWLIRVSLSLSDYLSVRDQGSRVAAERLGVHPAPTVRPDIVFGRGSLDHARVLDPTRGRKVVALGVLDYYGWSNDPIEGRDDRRDYHAKIVSLATRLLDAGYEVRIVGGAKPDAKIASQVFADVQAARPGAPVVLPPVVDFKSLGATLADADVLVASRFHNLIAGLSLAVPSVSIAYGQKQTDLMVDFGLGDFDVLIDRFDPEVVAGQVEDLLGRAAECSEQIRAHTEGLRLALAEQDVCIISHVRDRGRSCVGADAS